MRLCVRACVLWGKLACDGPSACHLAGALGIVGNDWEGMASLVLSGGVITEWNPCRNSTSGSIRIIHGWYSETGTDRQCHTHHMMAEMNTDCGVKNANARRKRANGLTVIDTDTYKHKHRERDLYYHELIISGTFDSLENI